MSTETWVFIKDIGNFARVQCYFPGKKHEEWDFEDSEYFEEYLGYIKDDLDYEGIANITFVSEKYADENFSKGKPPKEFWEEFYKQVRHRVFEQVPPYLSDGIWYYEYAELVNGEWEEGKMFTYPKVIEDIKD